MIHSIFTSHPSFIISINETCHSSCHWNRHQIHNQGLTTYSQQIRQYTDNERWRHHGWDDFDRAVLVVGSKKETCEKGGSEKAQTSQGRGRPSSEVVGRIWRPHSASLSCKQDGRSTFVISRVGTSVSWILVRPILSIQWPFRSLVVGVSDKETYRRKRRRPTLGTDTLDRVHDTGIVSFPSSSRIGSQWRWEICCGIDAAAQRRLEWNTPVLFVFDQVLWPKFGLVLSIFLESRNLFATTRAPIVVFFFFWESCHWNSSLFDAICRQPFLPFQQESHQGGMDHTFSGSRWKGQQHECIFADDKTQGILGRSGNRPSRLLEFRNHSADSFGNDARLLCQSRGIGSLPCWE